MPQDGSELSEAALVPVFQLLSHASPSVSHEIHLLRVVALPTVAGGLGGEAYITDAFWEEECKHAGQDLRSLVQRLEQAKPKAVRCVLTSAVVGLL